MDRLRCKGWRRPTFPQANAVSSARRGLTSLFGMGRGGPPCYSHHVYLSRHRHGLKEIAGAHDARIYVQHLCAFRAVVRTGA